MKCKTVYEVYAGTLQFDPKLLEKVKYFSCRSQNSSLNRGKDLKEQEYKQIFTVWSKNLNVKMPHELTIQILANPISISALLLW